MTQTRAGSLPRWLDAILVEPVGTGLATAIFVGAGLVSIAMGRGIEDEGLTLARGSAAMWHAPVPIFFFLRMRPLAAAFYAVPSLGGTTAFCIAHLLVAATAFPMLRSIASVLGHRLPNLPGLLAAGSTAFLGAAVTGGSTSDGLVMVVAFVFAWRVLRSPIAAGALLGLMPLVRPELGALGLVVAVHFVFQPEGRARLLGAAGLAALLYFGAGAIYQRDVLWPLHYPPNPPQGAWGPGGMDWARELRGINLRSTIEQLLVCTPMLPFAIVGAVRFSPRGPLRALAAFLAFMLVLLTVLPRLGLFGGFGARYLVTVLPLITLFAARVIESTEDVERDPRGALLFGIAAGACLASFAAVRDVLTPWTALYVLASCALAFGARSQAPSYVPPILAQFSLGSLFVMAALTPGLREGDSTHAMVRWMAREGLPSAEHLVYTNDQLLPYVVERERSESSGDVRFFFQADITATVAHITNAANGQTPDVLAAMGDATPGTTVDAASVTPDDVPPGSLLVYRDDPRLWLTLDEAAFASRLQERARFGSMVVAEMIASRP